MAQARSSDDRATFELVPLLTLPEVDLSVSVRSRFVHNATLRHILRVVGASLVLFLGYVAYLCVVLVVFFGPVSIGRPLAIAGGIMGLPGALNAIANLRYEMIVVMLRTYDAWYFFIASTVVSVLLGNLLHDARAFTVGVSWLAFFVFVFVDAGVVGLRRVWIAKLIASVCFLSMATAVSIGITDRLVPFDFLRVNQHTVSAISVIREGLITMSVLMLRNVYRERRHITQRIAPLASTIRVQCVSFRCRLRYQQVTASETSTQAAVPDAGKVAEASTPALSEEVTKTRLQYVAFLQPVSVRDTLIPGIDKWLWEGDSLRCQRCFLACGCIGFLVACGATILALLFPTLARHPCVVFVTALATGLSIHFIAMSIATTQRQVMRALVTSFDFIFINVQVMIAHTTLVALCQWHPTMTLAVATVWLWNLLFMGWDAILPPVRQRLGITPRFVACISTGIGLTMVSCATLLFTVLPPEAIVDRLIWKVEGMGADIEIRPLSWYVSSHATVIGWSLRIFWRVWRAEDDELILLDGPVQYERHSRHHPVRQQ